MIKAFLIVTIGLALLFAAGPLLLERDREIQKRNILAADPSKVDWNIVCSSKVEKIAALAKEKGYCE